MADEDDIVGNVFGDLTVLEFKGSNKHQKRSYLCRCKCGNELILARSAITHRTNKFCLACVVENISGIKSPHRKGYKLICGRFWTKLIARCKELSREFNLSIEYAYDLFEKQNGLCALSGIPLYFAQTYKEIQAGMNTASLDRIDYKQGYVIGNVQWVHKDINWMKQKLSQADFIQYCCAIADHNMES